MIQLFLTSVLISAVAAVPMDSVSKRATGETVVIPNLANWNKNNVHDGVGQGTDRYTLHLGSGQTWDGWPARSSWVSFEEM
jgi:hypothetical protein